MTIIETLNNWESWSVIRWKINDNFSNLNADKLETSAYTAADIKTKYESNANTNAFTDTEKTKLANIQAGAEVNTINDVIAWTNITIDKTDPLNPVISAAGWSGSWDVVWPASATNNWIALFDWTTGKLIKDSAKTITTTLWWDDTTIPTSKAVADAIWSAGGWDMLKSVYDPQNISADAFDRANHTWTQSIDTITETTDKKVMTASERDEILESRWSYITGWTGVSINWADNTTFDLNIQGVIKDNDVLYDINVNQTWIVVTDFSWAVTYVLVNKDWTIIQQKTPATEAQLYNHLWEFILVHANNTNLNVVNNYILKWDNVLNQYQWLARALWFINKNGWNKYTPNGANLNIDKSAWSVYYPWIWDNNVLTQAGWTAISFRIRNQDWTETANTTTLDVANYDVWWTTTALPLWTNIYATYRVFLFASSNTTVLQRPQFTYATLEEAINWINFEDYQIEDNLWTNALFRWYIVFRKNTTDLSNETQNKFISPTSSGIWGTVTFTPNFQAVYNISTPTAELVTNTDNGALSLQEWTWTNSNDVLEVKNNAWTTTFSVTGNWDVTANNLQYELAEWQFADWDKTKLDWIEAGAEVNEVTLAWTETLTNKTLTDAKLTYALNTQTWTTYTLALTDQSKIVEMNNASANTVTIPTNASVSFPVGTTITIIQYGAWLTTLQWDTWVVVNGVSAWSVALTAQYQWFALYKRATDEWILVNQITS